MSRPQPPLKSRVGNFGNGTTQISPYNYAYLSKRSDASLFTHDRSRQIPNTLVGSISLTPDYSKFTPVGTITSREIPSLMHSVPTDEDRLGATLHCIAQNSSLRRSSLSNNTKLPTSECLTVKQRLPSNSPPSKISRESSNSSGTEL